MEFERVTLDGAIDQTAVLADEIWRECYGALLSEAQIGYMLERFQSVGAIRRQMEEEGYLYYLLRLANETMGYLAVQPEGGKLLLSKVYLLKSARGQGHSPAIFSFAEGLARQLGCGTLWLTVNKGNARAVAAYEKAGFVRVREQVADIGGGFVMDDYIYEKMV